MLLGDSLAVLGQPNDRHSNRQSLLVFVELGAASLLVAKVLQVQIEVVEIIDCEDKSAFVDIQFGIFHAVTVFGENRDGDLVGCVRLAILKQVFLESALVTLPVIHDFVGEGMHDFVLGLNDASRSLFLLRLLTIIIVILSVDSGLASLTLHLGLLLSLHLLLVLLHFLANFFLKLGLLLIDINIVEEFVFCCHFDCHELRLPAVTLAIDMLHDFVVRTQLFLVLCQHTVHAIDGGVSYKLLELGHPDEVGNVGAEDYIVSHADGTLVILIVLSFADTVGQAPRDAFFAVGADLLNLVRLVDRIMPRYVHEGLLVEELLL